MKHELRMLYSTQEQSNHGKRNTALDMARGIAIILIVIGHSSYVGGVPAVWLSTFHLPAFFLLSGWLLTEKEENKRSVKELILRKASAIFVPYFWFSAGSLVLDFIQVLRGSFTWDILLQHFLETVSLQGYSVMWFLPVIFLAQIGVDLVGQTVRRMNSNSVIRHILSAVVWTVIALLLYGVYKSVVIKLLPAFATAEVRIVVKAAIGAAFMAYGALMSHAVKGIAKKGKKAKNALFATGIFCVTVNILVSFWCGHMDLNNLNVGFLPTYFLLGTIGSLGLILVCMKLPNVPLLTFYGQNSLIIMCTHLNFYVMYLAIRITDVLTSPIAAIPQPVWVVLMFSVTMLLEIPVILLIRMLFPFVLGRARAHREVSKREK